MSSMTPTNQGKSQEVIRDQQSLADRAAQGTNSLALSDRAKGVLGAQFGLIGQKASVTYHTPWNRTPEAVAVYDELVAAGCLSAVYGVEGRHALTYRAKIDCRDAYTWVAANLDSPALRFPMMVPADQRKERPPRGWRPTPASPKDNPQTDGGA